MAEQPQEFLNWLFANYTDKEAKAIYNAIGRDDENGLYYLQYWEDNIKVPELVEPESGELGFPKEAWDYINEWTTKEDLMDRLREQPLPDAVKAEVYDDILGNLPEGEEELRESRGREFAAQEKIRLGEETEAEELRLRKEATAQGVTRELLDIRDEQARIRQVSKGLREEQAGRAFIAGLGEPVERRRRPGIPGAGAEVEGYLEGTGLAEGSRLRSYIQSQMGDVVSGVAGERKRWWDRATAPEPTTYEDEVGRITREGEKWGRIAQTAPTSEYAGGTYFGVGGLAASAQRAFETSQRNLAQLEPFEAEKPEPAGEDPLIAELGRKTLKDYLAEFRGLTARQRGFQATRFKPAVRF